MVETKNLRKVYRTGDEKVVALDNIDRVIEIIRGSANVQDAKASLIEEFALDLSLIHI